jgi:2-oxo-3-hexenedioate decarboxylase
MRRMEPDFTKWAKVLDEAMLSARAVPRLTKERPDLAMEDAYAIQDLVVNHRIRRGERLIGWKMGMTSKVKMKQMGVKDPIYGILTDAMHVPDAGVMQLKGRIHPKIEPEVAFLIGKDLEGPVSPAQVLQATNGVCAALEVIDSRFENFEFQLPDVVADNTSASGFVLGNFMRKTDRLDLGNLGIVFEVNGVPVQFGSTAAILGHPARSIAELVNMLAKRDLTLKAGSIVLAGGATAAVPVASGDRVKVSIHHLGSAEVRVV